MTEHRPYITCIAIGDELLSGNTKDSNTHFIAKMLLENGYYLNNVIFVGDLKEEIIRVVRDALTRSDIVIVTGGLGPTPDDITRYAVADALNLKLELFHKLIKDIHETLKHLSKKIRIMSEVEALLPKGCTPLKNLKGVAPGFRLSCNKSNLFCIPGVPKEAESMFEKSILPFIKRKFPPDKTIHYVLKTIGIGESALHHRIKPYLTDSISVGFYPKMREVELRIHIPIKQKKIGEKLYNSIKKELADFIYADFPITIEELVSSKFKEKKMTIATAESCTGGLIAKRITDIPGSSSFFKGSIVAYSNELKENLLNVKPETLNKFGAVSKEVAKQMVLGLEQLLNIDFALSVTGLAGPQGGTKIKPIGLVYVGIKYKEKLCIKKFNFTGDREKIRWLTSQAVFHLIWQMIR